MLLRQRQNNVVLSVFHTLQYARQEAIHQHRVVHVENLSTACTKSWSTGLRVFTHTPLTTEKIILRVFQIEQQISIFSNQPCGFTFISDGRCITPGTLTFPNDTVHTIVINDSGRPRIHYY